MNFPKILRGVTGEPELIRSLGALGVFAFIFSSIGFEGWNMARGVPFDIAAFCLAFGTGFAAVMGAIGGAAAIKDRGVAAARATESQTTGATQ